MKLIHFIIDEFIGLEFFKFSGPLCRNQPEKWLEHYLYEDIFVNIFAIIDDFLKFRTAFGALHFENSSNRAKILTELKTFAQAVLKPLLLGNSKNPKH